jgi:hypothetical protein
MSSAQVRVEVFGARVALVIVEAHNGAAVLGVDHIGLVIIPKIDDLTFGQGVLWQIVIVFHARS